MNFNSTQIITAIVVILAIPYLIIVLRRASSQNFSFIKALNPFYTKEMQEADDLKKSISPILDEIESQRVAKFIKHWSDKFENNRLTVQDVESLNAKIAEGNTDQVNGILAIHPEGRAIFNSINQDLQLKAAAKAEKDSVLA
jgi:predicted PurR-regulated permease PerM